MLNYLTINTGAEFICFIIALVCLTKDRSFAWRSMLLFLFIICITETIGVHIKKLYLADTVHVHPNIWIYNILLIFQIGFISFMFKHLLDTYIKSKPVILSGLILLAILYIIDIFTHGVFVKHNLTTIVMSVLFVLYSLYYFYLLLRSEDYINLKFSSDFWWVAGILFFYFGRIVSLLFFQILSTFSPNFVVTVPIYNVLNIILYSCWSYSFICRKWLTTTLKA
ncbi:MAG: hypothetical protein JWP45_2191 [Mucilaginibacter sp.]|nr:hypothetical protein [Mucilaginibacter sp.]